MLEWLEKACDEIDSAIFTGDSFHDVKAKQELRDYMARWERGLKAIDEEKRNG